MPQLEALNFTKDRALLDHITEIPNEQLYARAMHYETLSRDTDFMPHAKETVQRYLGYFVFEVSQREHELAMQLTV